jgi:hypothetical protein
VLGGKWGPNLKTEDMVICCLVGSTVHLRAEVTDEYGALVEWWLAREAWRSSEKSLLQCCFIQQKSHMESSWSDQGVCSEKAPSNHPTYGTANWCILCRVKYETRQFSRKVQFVINQIHIVPLFLVGMSHTNFEESLTDDSGFKRCDTQKWHTSKLF